MSETVTGLRGVRGTGRGMGPMTVGWSSVRRSSTSQKCASQEGVTTTIFSACRNEVEGPMRVALVALMQALGRGLRRAKRRTRRMTSVSCPSRLPLPPTKGWF